MDMTIEAHKARAAYMKEYREKNKNRINSRKREWNCGNKDKIRKYNERYWEKKAQHKEDIMDALGRIALDKAIGKQIEELGSELTKELISGCVDTDSTEEVYARMFVNAIRISVRMAAGIFFDVLFEQGLVARADEEQLRRSVLKAVK